MLNSLFIKLADQLPKCGNFDKSDHELYANILLVYNCMPTLLHLKPASLIQINKKAIWNTGRLVLIIENYVKIYACSCLCLYENDHCIHLLIYNRQMLDKALSDSETEDYLIGCGYSMPDGRLEDAFSIWQQRYANYFRYRYADSNFYKSRYNIDSCQPVFPHEIGLLLGYPLKDVIAFIQNHGRNYILSGYWKVYYDKEMAAGIFESYDKARICGLKKLEAGKTLDLS